MLNEWHVYIVRCSDGSLYTGVTKDVGRRINEHNSDDVLGAKYTRPRRPVVLVYQEAFPTRADACRREYAVKRLDRVAKEALIGG